ncbi:MAG TPA: 30S ribosomal protein S7 [Nitrospirota bacterium]|nr:30S ribosomal protein S7 [Nitrospirota bacterium]
MPRKQVVVKREILPDPKYNSKLLAKFVNVLMRKGKKSTAEAIAYKALDRIKDKTSGDPIAIFKKAIDNLKPSLEVKSRRVGGASYQVPIEVKQPRRLSLAYRWLRFYASQRAEKSMVEKLAGEILDASNNTGLAIKKKDDVHRMAEANKAFAHYRW